MLALASSIDENTVISLSMPIRMGGGYIPVVGASKSSGTISVNDGLCKLSVIAVNTTGSSSYVFDLPEMGTVSYSSHNNYYVDQDFSYENGALIVSQRNRSIMKLFPSVYFRQIGGNNYSVNINSIVLAGDSFAFSGNGIQDVRMNSNSSVWLFENNETLTDVTISVNSSYPSSWASYFNASARMAGLTYTTDYTLSQGDDYASIFISPAGSVELYLKKSTIDVATGIF